MHLPISLIFIIKPIKNIFKHDIYPGINFKKVGARN